MKKSFIDRFFAELDRQWRGPAEIILTGAAAGSLLGRIRPSLDIDFEIRQLKSRGARPRAWHHQKELSEAIQRAAAKAGIAVNFAEDISRWSMIDYLDYRKTALPYKTIGRLRVKIMAPGHWTIGKMTRFFEIDIEDMVHVLRKKKIRVQPLILLWARALRLSPLSLASGAFRDHVIYFLTRYGKSVWGRSFDSGEAIAHFERAAKQK